MSTLNEELNTFTVYPNPSISGIFNFLSSNNDTYYVEIFDVTGRTIVSKIQLENKIDLSKFSKGIYIAKINSKGKSKTVKLIKD